MNIVLISWNPYFNEVTKASTRLSGFSVGFVEPLVRHLLTCGYQVGLISPDPGGNCNDRFPVAPSGLHHINLRGVSVPKVAFLNGELSIKAALLSLDGEFGGIDVVLVVYAFPHVITIAEMKTKLGYRVFTFLRGSDVYPGCQLNSHFRSAFGEHWPYVHRLYVDAINASDRVFCVSEIMAATARSEGVRVDGIYPTPPFEYDPRKLDGTRSDLRTLLLESVEFERPPDPKKRWLVYGGRFHVEKRIDVFVEAVHEIPDCESIVVGDGEDIDWNRAPYVPCVGFVPPSVFPLLCRCTDIAVLPGNSKTFIDARPSVCTNFAHHGVPIVFSFNDGIPNSGMKEIVSPLNFEMLRVDGSLHHDALVAAYRERLVWLLSNEPVRSQIAIANAHLSRKQRLDRVMSQVMREIINSGGTDSNKVKGAEEI